MKSRITKEQGLSTLALCANAAVVMRKKLTYAKMRKMLTSAPPGMAPFPYPFGEWEDKVLRRIIEFSKMKKADREYFVGDHCELARYLVGWAESLGSNSRRCHQED